MFQHKIISHHRSIISHIIDITFNIIGMKIINLL